VSQASERTRGSPQLALSVSLDDAATLENFLAWEAVAAAYARASGALDGDALTLLHGEPEGGKSHLLQALCHRVPGAVYLPLGTVREYPAAAVLDGLESAALLALDDLHQVAGLEDWEEALFHLVNRARAQGCPLWLASRRPPTTPEIALADLRSRLAGGYLWALPAPGDEVKVRILQFRAERRGLRLPGAVAQYLLARETRTLASMLATLDELDRASLRSQRPLTIPFLREVMGW
jgi:DnaA family protein